MGTHAGAQTGARKAQAATRPAPAAAARVAAAPPPAAPTAAAAEATPATAAGPAAPAVAFLDAMHAALTQAPGVSLAAARVRAAGHEVERARGKHLPTLSVNSGLNGSSSQGQGATASLNLWAAGAIEALVSQQRATFDSGRYAVQSACAEALLRAGETYVQALRTGASVDLLNQHLTEYRSIHDMVSQIAAVDRGRRIDVEQVLTRQGLVQLQLLEAQTQARQSRLLLARLLGQPAEPVADSVDTVVAGLLPRSSQDAVAMAREASPALAAGKREIDAARHGVDVARGARWPQLNLVANSRRDRVDGVRQRDDRVGLQLQWSLFNGGSDFYAEKTSLEAVAAAQARLEEVQRDIDVDVDRTWEEMSAARARSAQQAQQARPARAVLDANRELFRLGKRSVLDILNAANDVHAVRAAASDARFEAWLRGLRLHILTGRLMPELRLTAPSTCAADTSFAAPSLVDALGPPK